RADRRPPSAASIAVRRADRRPPSAAATAVRRVDRRSPSRPPTAVRRADRRLLRRRPSAAPAALASVNSASCNFRTFYLSIPRKAWHPFHLPPPRRDLRSSGPHTTPFAL